MYGVANMQEGFHRSVGVVVAVAATLMGAVVLKRRSIVAGRIACQPAAGKMSLFPANPARLPLVRPAQPPTLCVLEVLAGRGSAGPGLKYKVWI